MNPLPLRVVVGVSGGGRTARNLWEQQRNDGYHIVGMISSHPDCAALSLCREQGLPLLVESFGAQASPDLPQRISTWLGQLQVDLIALAGFLKPFPHLPAYAQRIINIHPALLPAFGGPGMYGLHVHRAVLAAGARQSGATIHFVSERYDEGAIIAQLAIDVPPAIDAQALAEQVFAAECRLYPYVLEAMARGQLPLAAGHLTLKLEDIP